jgi:hypothetical protein
MENDLSKNVQRLIFVATDWRSGNTCLSIKNWQLIKNVALEKPSDCVDFVIGSSARKLIETVRRVEITQTVITLKEFIDIKCSSFK